MPSWRRKQSAHEQVVVKNCRYCHGNGYLAEWRCEACKGTGKAQTMYAFPKGWKIRRRKK